MAKTNKKTNEYEVYLPVKYCEVWVVKARSKKDAKRKAQDQEGECVGGVRERSKVVLIRRG